jgi:hypothetical protein
MFAGTDSMLNTESISSQNVNLNFKFNHLEFTHAKFLLWSQKLWECKPAFRDVATGVCVWGGGENSPHPQLWNSSKNQVKFKLKFWLFQVKFA